MARDRQNGLESLFLKSVYTFLLTTFAMSIYQASFTNIGNNNGVHHASMIFHHHICRLKFMTLKLTNGPNYQNQGKL